MHEVAVAAITAVPATVAALAAWRSAARSTKEAKEANTHLQGNGLGTVPHMLEQLLRGQGGLTERLDAHIADDNAHRSN